MSQARIGQESMLLTYQSEQEGFDSPTWSPTELAWAPSRVATAEPSPLTLLADPSCSQPGQGCAAM